MDSDTNGDRVDVSRAFSELNNPPGDSEYSHLRRGYNGVIHSILSCGVRKHETRYKSSLSRHLQSFLHPHQVKQLDLWHQTGLALLPHPWARSHFACTKSLRTNMMGWRIGDTVEALAQVWWKVRVPMDFNQKIGCQMVGVEQTLRLYMSTTVLAWGRHGWREGKETMLRCSVSLEELHTVDPLRLCQFLLRESIRKGRSPPPPRRKQHVSLRMKVVKCRA